MSAKYRQLADILRSELPTVAKQGGRLPTEAELSIRYHMSRQTIRHALQLLSQEGLIQSRQGSGSYITEQAFRSTSMQIAILVSYTDDYIFPKLLHELQDQFSRSGFSISIYSTENLLAKERHILQSLLAADIAGILVEGTKTTIPSPNDDLYQKLHSNGVPIVFFHGVPNNLSMFPYSLDDNISGGCVLTEYLLEKGHRHIGGLFKSDDMQGSQRCHGMLCALRNYEMPDDLIGWYDTRDRDLLVYEHDFSPFDKVLRPFLDRMTAIVCYNDEIAFLLIRYLSELEKKVPEDIAVVSFDDSYYSQIGPIPITSLRHHTTTPWTAAAKNLIGILSGTPAENTLSPWKLISRQSG